MRSSLRALGALHPDRQGGDEPVALETTVIATGARPGASGAKRELFTEETQTVLVFERGAVIRLSAGVGDGQLLFLANKKTGKEVVTQVLRKRSFRPTSCYVDLEFTEPSPGFWGIEFPKSAPPAPSQSSSVAGEDDESRATEHAAPPDLAEVEHLKREVTELQTQLSTLIGSTPAAIAAPVSSAATENDSAHGAAAKKHDEKVFAQLLAQEAEQERMHGPTRLVAYPQKSASLVVKRAGKLAMAGAFVAVIVAAGIAAYRFGLLDSWLQKPAAKPTPTHVAAAANPAAPSHSVTAVSAPRPANEVKSLAIAGSGNSGVNSGGSSVAAPLSPNGNSLRTETTSTSDGKTVAKEVKRSNGMISKRPVGISATRPSPAPTKPLVAAPAEVTNLSATEEYVAPKLIYSVKPVSPPEALRNYVTGNVNVDALVDVTGHVKSVTVISGPQKLRNTAIVEMKQYVYEPARKNGRPVVAHVRASLKYWYEP